MSLYEMLPQKQPQPETLPDNGDSRHDDAWLDPGRVAQRAGGCAALGEGPATAEKNVLINRALAKIGIRLALSLSPAVGWSVAVTVTAAEAGRHRHDSKALKKMVKRFALNIPEEGLWAGGYAGTRAAINAVIKARTEQAIREATEKMAAEARARLQALFDEENYARGSDLLSMLALAGRDDDDGATETEEDSVDDDISVEAMKTHTVHGSTVYASAEEAGKAPISLKFTRIFMKFAGMMHSRLGAQSTPITLTY